jgi:hypothetical protein
MRRRFYYDKELGVARVVLNKKGITAWGIARLHPDDADYGSEYTGLGIAEMRAQKDFLEKRARAKRKEYKRLLAKAEYYKDLYETDFERAQELDDTINQFIKDKAELHQKLRHPQKRVEWKTLPENFFDGVELEDAKSIGALEQGK